MSNYEKTVKERMIKKYPKKLFGGTFRGKPYPHIFVNREDNFIDGKYPITKNIKGSLEEGEIEYNGEKHINSSQVMCISYFKKFFEKEEYEPLLAEILMMLKIDVSGTSFSTATFEYMPDGKERTNFDFYLTLSDGRSISWEIKFTESKFGGTTKTEGTNDKYIKKWHEIYTPALRACAYYNYPSVDCDDFQCLSSGKLENTCVKCHDCSIYDFYNHYQIRRNITLATKPGSYVIFLTPRENINLDDERKYIDKYAREWAPENIKNIYWEDLIEITLKVVSCDDYLYDYFSKFQAKYFE